MKKEKERSASRDGDDFHSNSPVLRFPEKQRQCRTKSFQQRPNPKFKYIIMCVYTYIHTNAEQSTKERREARSRTVRRRGLHYYRLSVKLTSTEI